MNIEFSIVMPCLNEAETLGTCIEKAQKSILKNSLSAEIVIADNGSTDGSQEIARDLGAKVVDVDVRGYGSALKAGIKHAKGKYVIMADADDSYNFLGLEPFIEKLRQGYELVMGNRFKGGVEKGAMPPLHRYLGNPVLSFIGRLFFSTPIGDFHCGLRGFNRESILGLSLVCNGMEFASEMVVKASKKSLKIIEVPTTLSPDGRSRPPHLNSWRDGWRHLKFLLIYSPRWLFLYPGIFLFGVGAISLCMLNRSAIRVFDLNLDIHTMVYASAAVIVGLQMIHVAMFTRQLGTSLQLFKSNKYLRMIHETLTIELLIVLGLMAIVAGSFWTVEALYDWRQTNFGTLYPTHTMRRVIMAVTLTISGVQVLIYSFFTSVIDFFSVSSSISQRDA